MEKYNSRNDVPEKYKWDLTDFYQNIDEFKNKLEDISNKIDIIKTYQGCTKDPKKLLEFIECNNEYESEILNLFIYSKVLSDQDLSISENSAYYGQVSNLNTKYELLTNFFVPELLKLSDEEYNRLFEYESLKIYKEYLDDIYRFKGHQLTEKEEQIITELTQNMSDYEQMALVLINSNHDYGKIKYDSTEEELSITNYRKIIKKFKSDRQKRKEIYEQLNSKINQYISMNASLLNDFAKENVSLAKIHNFESPWEEYLFNTKLNNKVFSSLKEAAYEKKAILNKYYDLIKKTQNISKIFPWDSVLELFETNKEYSIEETQNIILEALKPLGDDYIKHLKKVFDDRCIDYCQYKGKCSGGYNISSDNKINSKILMSFNYDLQSVSTVAHESGHHVNHQYNMENNIIVYRNTPTIPAEIASLTNECLLSYYLIKNGTKEQALEGLSNIIKVFYYNFNDAIREGYIEEEYYKYIQNNGILTKDYMGDLVQESYLKFFPINDIDHPYQKDSWATRFHYFTPFYLYPYSVCIAVAIYIAQRISNGDTEIRNKYIDFLKTGSNMSIIDRVKILGIDLENKEIYLNAMDEFEKLLDKFKTLINN